MVAPRPSCDVRSVELDRLLVTALRDAYGQLNWSLFGDALRAPVLQLGEAASRLGQWDRRARTLEISRALAFERPWGEVVEVLKHEMAHQFVHEVLGRVDEPPHGPSFRRVCAERGIDCRATGAPAAAEASPIHRKISRLLALAGSPNQHEAESAMAMAQRLMLEHNIELASAGGDDYGYRHLGEPTGRITAADRYRAAILQQFFFVEAVWMSAFRARDGKRGRILEICGTPENLDIAAYVYDFLGHAAESLWQQHRRARYIRSNGDRLTFHAGVMRGFWDKLEAQQQTDAGEGLVWVGDPALDGYFRRRHPRLRRMRRTTRVDRAAFGHGRSAGRSLVLRRAVEQSGGNGGRLLGPASD